MKMAVAKFSNKLASEAVKVIREEWCKEFFQGRKNSPDRIYCKHYEGMTKSILESYGFSNNPQKKPYYTQASIPIESIRADDSLHTQDRRDLSNHLVRQQTMHSMQACGEDIDAPAIVARLLQDGSYIVGDGRHRLLWASALGCTHVNCWIVHCDDEQWEGLRDSFNDMNGAQRTLDERILLVHKYMLKGGASMASLCLRHGVPISKYRTFAEEQRLKESAKTSGLKLKGNEAPAIIEKALEVQQKHNTELAQKVLEVSATSTTNDSKPKTPPSKTAIAQAINPILKDSVDDTTVNEALHELGKVVRKGGRVQKDYATRLRQGIDELLKVRKKTTAAGIGLAKREKAEMIVDLNSVVAWLNG
jgi:hypothetical protein